MNKIVQNIFNSLIIFFTITMAGSMVWVTVETPNLITAAKVFFSSMILIVLFGFLSLLWDNFKNDTRKSTEDLQDHS